MEIAPPRMPDDPDRLRVCSVSGITGSVLVLVAFFLPWAEVDPGVAASFRDSVESSRVASSVVPREDWNRIAAQLTDDPRVSGLDIFYWARTALVTASSDTLAKGEDRRVAARSIRVATVWLAAIPLAAFVLLVYFLLHHCRRSRSPALILATLTGAAAMATAAAGHIASGALEGYVTSGVAVARGMKLLPIGGAVLFLAGTFGVRFANWWRVFSGALVLGAVLAAWIAAYVRG